MCVWVCVCCVCRFPLGKLRSSVSSGKHIPLKTHCLSAETEKQAETEAPDYLPLVMRPTDGNHS